MGQVNIRQAASAQSYQRVVFALGLPDGRDSNAYLARAFQHYNRIRRQWRRSGQRSPARGYAEHGSGARFTGLDIRFSKRFRFEAPACKQAKELRAFRQLELVVDAFNVLNHPNLTNIVGDVSSPLFGKATAALPARTIQVALRFSFRACRE